MLDEKRILVVDDEPKIVEVVQSYLEKEGYIVSVAYDGKQALELFKFINPSLVLLDLMLPDMNGENICEEIRKYSKVPIIMLTAKIDEKSILQGFNLGTDDYITKPFSPKQLVARVQALLRRTENQITSSSYNYSFIDGDLTINFETLEVRKDKALINLTQTEFNLLGAMVKYPNKAFTREELVNIVFGTDYMGYDRVIDTHIKNLRQKIEDDTKEPQYILTVHGIGYKFGGN